MDTFLQTIYLTLLQDLIFLGFQDNHLWQEKKDIVVT